MTAIQNAYQSCCNGINKAYDAVGEFFDKNPTLYKVVLVVSHIFRAATMFGLMMWLPIHPAATASILLGGTLLYRAAVERFCCFRFAIPAMVGAMAGWAAKVAIVNFVSGAALTSVGMTIANSLALVPLAAYLGWVICLSHRDIETHMEKMNEKINDNSPACCSG